MFSFLSQKRWQIVNCNQITTDSTVSDSSGFSEFKINLESASSLLLASSTKSFIFRRKYNFIYTHHVEHLSPWNSITLKLVQSFASWYDCLLEMW